MKSFKTLIIAFESWEDFKTKTRVALKTKTKLVTKHTILFSSVVEYQKFMTEQKLAILATILKYEPKSIYQLASLVQRDFANVQRDCVALSSMGFMKFDETKHATKSKKPRLSFDYTRIVILMPQLSYSHELKEAA